MLGKREMGILEINLIRLKSGKKVHPSEIIHDCLCSWPYDIHKRYTGKERRLACDAMQNAFQEGESVKAKKKKATD